MSWFSDFFHDVVDWVNVNVDIDIYVSTDYSFDAGSGGPSSSSITSGASSSVGYTDPSNSYNWTSHTNYRDSAGHVIRDVGTFDNGDTWVTNYANGIVTNSTTYDTGTNDHDYLNFYSEFNQQGQVTVQTNNYDDGHHVGLLTDRGNQTWSAMSTYYGSNWQVISQTGTWDTSDTWSSGFTNGILSAFTYTDLGLNDQPWSTYSLAFDTAGQTLSETSNNDNGTHSIINYDPANTASYSAMTTYYGSNWQVTSQTGTYDTGDGWSSSYSNGVLSSFTYSDTGANDHSWSSYVYGYDAQGRVISETSNNDDSTHSILNRDPGNSAAYSLMTTYYGANWQITAQTGTYDTGDSWSSPFIDGVQRAFTYTDTGANDQAWSTYSYVFDAQGRVTSETSINDDGTRALTLRDPSNTENYSVLTHYYGANNLETLEVGTYDTGDSWFSNFTNGAITTQTITDAGANDHAWLNHVLTFNAAHQVTADSYLNDDGSHTVITNDVVNALTWATRTVETSSANATLSTVYVNDNNTLTFALGNGANITFDTNSLQSAVYRASESATPQTLLLTDDTPMTLDLVRQGGPVPRNPTELFIMGLYFLHQYMQGSGPAPDTAGPPLPMGVPAGSRFFFGTTDGTNYYLTEQGQLYEHNRMGVGRAFELPAVGNVPIAGDAAGACTWTRVNESMSDASRTYQEFITGVPSNLSCVVGTVKFGGFDYATGTFIEAKGPGYANENFYNADGSPKPWYEFSGHQGMIDQMTSQTTAAAGRPVVWYAATQHAADVMMRYITGDLVGKITVIYKAQP